jgi:hypothetical protein
MVPLARYLKHQPAKRIQENHNVVDLGRGNVNWLDLHVAIQESEFRQHGVSIIQQFVEPERKGGELQEERGDLEC